MAVLNTPKQVVPVRTHCHPLIGSFLILSSTLCQHIDGEVSRCQEPARPHWHRIKAGTNAARRQFGKPEHAQGREHPKTWPHSSCLYHRGVIGTWAFQSIFKGRNLIHMCTMKLAILYSASPYPSRPPPVHNVNVDLAIWMPRISSILSIKKSNAGLSFHLTSPQVWPPHPRLWRRTRMPNLHSWQDLSLFVATLEPMSVHADIFVCAVNMQMWRDLNKSDLLSMCLPIKLWSWV